jgi:hypothetical protein
MAARAKSAVTLILRVKSHFNKGRDTGMEQLTFGTCGQCERMHGLDLLPVNLIASGEQRDVIRDGKP